MKVAYQAAYVQISCILFIWGRGQNHLKTYMKLPLRYQMLWYKKMYDRWAILSTAILEMLECWVKWTSE